MYVWVQWLYFNISGHTHTNATSVSYIRTTFNTTTTTTNNTIVFLCGEWFVCAVVVAVTGGDGVVFV